MQRKIRVSEVFSLIFGNTLLITCAISACWHWSYVFCSNYDCQHSSSIYGWLAMLASILPFIPYPLFTIYAVASAKASEKARTDILLLCMLLVIALAIAWVIAEFIGSFIASSIIATLLCCVLIITDILYARAVVLERKL